MASLCRLARSCWAGSCNKSSASRIRNSSENKQFNQITAAREVDVAFMSGNPGIIQAWTVCMRRQGGGLVARFEPTSSAMALLHNEDFNQAGTYEQTLIETAYIPDSVVVRQNGACLRSGYIFRVGAPCPVLVELASLGPPLAEIEPTPPSAPERSWARHPLLRSCRRPCGSPSPHGRPEVGIKVASKVRNPRAEGTQLHNRERPLAFPTRLNSPETR